MSRKQRRGTNDEKAGLAHLEAMISYVLIIGVIASLLLEAVGLLLYYRTFGTVAISYDGRLVLYAHDFFDFLAQPLSRTFRAQRKRRKIDGPGHGDTYPHALHAGRAVGRFFASRKNVTYLIVTLFVLIVLSVSMLQ